MKKSIIALSVLVASSAFFSVAASASDTKSFDQLAIQADDSFALKVLKAAGGNKNTQDVEVSAEDWEKVNGSSGSVMALNMAAGTAGIGAFGGSGLSGGLLNAGLFFLGSTNKKPLAWFNLIQVIPASELISHSQQLSDYLAKDIGTEYKIGSVKIGSQMTHPMFVKNAKAQLPPYKKEAEWSYLTYGVSVPKSTLNAEQASSLFGQSFESGDYVVVTTTVSTCGELVLLDKLNALNTTYPSYLYVPPVNKVANRDCPEADKLRAEYQQVIDLDKKQTHLFIKPKA
ncbi:hypothetical protein [Morganella morganii]|uniref:hypothetical protein n=1 Tax=Morganella morganii TaxID=582 RepID=UPI0003DCC9B7|nr:hypothetical protein [Morganella morganii]EJG2203486.1 hypothetical protein [Morganella morganii]ELN8407863.1 hypothetical protein [Morganella morganii]MDS0908937.1 hypothetical protein [Morganella morganii]OPL23140.1 hypothetical protein B5S45_16815 [Morganella morganii]RTY19875.1 hypothetical protein EKS23_12755 [Morganella morganii subsp. morganii]